MLEFLINYGLIGLFIACFLAATILPFSSDIVFGALIVAGLSPVPCLVIATIGNWLGGITNYYLGYLGKTEWIEKYLHVRKEKIDKMQNWLNCKGGVYLAFFSFLPVIGDLIPLALGFMRANAFKVIISMLAGKFCRYVFVYLLVHYGLIALHHG
ncbi:membrane protein [Bacteroidia bacterium]|nr:membrane protein [Bacteroidia bacterium]